MLWRSRSDAGDVHCVGVNAADWLFVDVKSRQTAIEYIILLNSSLRSLVWDGLGVMCDDDDVFEVCQGRGVHCLYMVCR